MRQLIGEFICSRVNGRGERLQPQPLGGLARLRILAAGSVSGDRFETVNELPVPKFERQDTVKEPAVVADED